MNFRKNIHQIKWSLYAIIDKEWLNERNIQDIAEEIICGGAGILQYRNKISTTRQFFQQVRSLQKITRAFQVPLIINDRVDIALAVGADGVHLGRDDLPVDVVRKIVGENMIVGWSISEIDDFAKADDADYLGVGAIYPTETHKTYSVTGLEIVSKLRLETDRPIVGIGGITPANCSNVIRAGANGVAVISGIMGAEDTKSASSAYLEAVRYVKRRN
jgi:thiamine-phosphate pyrophosphorylase